MLTITYGLGAEVIAFGVATDAVNNIFSKVLDDIDEKIQR